MTDTDLERRLRGALSAKAATVTRQDLHPLPAPSGTDRRSTLARWSLPLAAGAAAAAVTITAFALLRPTNSEPVQPVSPPSPTYSTSVPAPAETTSQVRPPSAEPATSPPAPTASPHAVEATPTASLSGIKPTS